MANGFYTYYTKPKVTKDIEGSDYIDISFVGVPYTLLQRAYKLLIQSTHIHTESFLQTVGMWLYQIPLKSEQRRSLK